MSLPVDPRHEIDPLVFKPEPPTDPDLVRRLFSGRERILQLALGRLTSGLDLEGKRSSKAAKCPWVIHGESRSGKSHLARRIFAELPETDTRLQIRVIAGGKLDAVSVMREVFDELGRRFTTRFNDNRLKKRTVEMQVVRQLVDRIGLFEPGAQTVTLTFDESTRTATEIGGELGGGLDAIPFLGGLLGKFILRFQKERSQKNGIQLLLRPPTAGDLAEVCGIMAECLLSHGSVQHVLVLLDDFDLLETYASPQDNAKSERSLLGHALRLLHAVPGVDVVLTARSWYFNSEEKHLITLLDLFDQPMPPEEMLGIYDLRLRTYAPGRNAADFIMREAVDRLANEVSGFPGIFLQHVHTAFYQYQSEPEARQRGYDWLQSVAKRQLEALRGSCRAGYEAILQAAREGQTAIDIREKNPFHGTRLENQYAYQSYFSETSYFVSPFVRKLFDEASSEKR